MILLGLKACGIGLNLTATNHVPLLLDLACISLFLLRHFCVKTLLPSKGDGAARGDRLQVSRWRLSKLVLVASMVVVRGPRPTCTEADGPGGWGCNCSCGCSRRCGYCLHLLPFLPRHRTVCRPASQLVSQLAHQPANQPVSQPTGSPASQPASQPSSQPVYQSTSHPVLPAARLQLAAPSQRMPWKFLEGTVAPPLVYSVEHSRRIRQARRGALFKGASPRHCQSLTGPTGPTGPPGTGHSGTQASGITF